ncbi:hypothetical protein HGRIS_012734 [Hohenbuehelia grisea]|uniref:DUF6533 domain-containing protein n=1 Tax=Hohenbuehelia grisea TaxID=104357 RepID=A0ABR3ITF0_9AGAR
MATMIHAATAQQLSRYIDVASFAVLVYDHLVTLDLEVSLIWPTPWNITKSFYLLSRYSPFLDAINAIYHQPINNIGPKECRVSYSIAGWLFMFGICLSEVILSFRTWAVWGRDRRLTIGLPVFLFAAWAPIIFFTWRFLHSLHFTQTPYTSVIGCFVDHADPILFYSWVMLMIYEAGLMALMAIRGYNVYRTGGNSALFNVVYRDGILYYVYLFSISLINVVLVNTLGVSFKHLSGLIYR